MFSIKDTPGAAAPDLISEHQLFPRTIDEISLVTLFGILAREKRALLRNIAIAVALALPVVFLVPVKFTAEAVILTPQQPQPSLAAMAQLSGSSVAALPSLSLLSGFSLRNPADLYTGILQSRTVADGLVTKFKLVQVYGAKDLTRARKRLARNTTIESGKDSLIHIRVEDRNPARAADLANAYVEALSNQNSRLALTEAFQRRAFYQTELSREKEQLADAEVALKQTEQTTGLVVPSGQMDALIRSGAQLRAEILARQAQVAAMGAYATDDNPRLQIAKRELGVLEGQLNRLEAGGKKAGVLDLPTGQFPEAGLEYVRKLRDVKYHEALFEILAKQYEAARLDEAKLSPLIQVVDRAIVPERKSWPPRTLLVLAAVTFTAIATSFWMLLAYIRDRREPT
jgi:tyrosine-protein kinase Etk/Wzc